MSLTAVAMVLLGASHTYGNHLRDTEDMCAYEGLAIRASRAQYCERVAWCALADVGQNLVLLAAAFGFWKGRLDGGTLLLVSVAPRPPRHASWVLLRALGTA